jgi:3-oxoacyl-[acyl-carrier-protein] synthase II
MSACVLGCAVRILRPTACAAGTHAIGDAYKIIQRGAADVMVSGGCEAAITPLALGGFCAMRRSPRNDAPARQSSL